MTEGDLFLSFGLGRLGSTKGILLAIIQRQTSVSVVPTTLTSNSERPLMGNVTNMQTVTGSCKKHHLLDENSKLQKKNE